MHKFLPYYPDKDTLTPQDFLSEISSKKEFIANSFINEKLFPHQEFITRFVSPYTKYDSLLLFHEMGSGKTQSAIAVAELLMTNPNSGITKTIVIVRGRGLGQNFVNELVYKGTDEKYVSEKGKPWKKFYEIWTMEVFGKNLARLTDRDLLNQFNNKLFVIDEAHHLKHPREAYTQIHRLLHLLPHRKVLLLTGTPMKDDVSEFVNCANLMLSLENQLPVGADFNHRYYPKNILKHKRSLIRRLTGLVSFYQGERSNVEKVFKGTIVPPMEHIPLEMCPLSDFQERSYHAAHLLDTHNSVVYINSRQASLFVFPDGSYGRAGFEKYVKIIKKTTLLGKVTETYKLEPEFVTAVKTNLHVYSAKYKRILDHVLSPNAGKTFVYTEFVHGGGAILLGEILKLHGYSQATGKETMPGRRFILATTKSINNNIIALIQRFNNKDNDRGDIIQLFIGSQIISEGYSLMNIADEFILTPHWNISEIEQIIARGWRINSHTIPGIKLSIHLLAVQLRHPIGDKDIFKEYGIDIYMYQTSESKDYKIKQLERLLKEISVDCHNHIPLDRIHDGTRDCDYTTCAVECLSKPQSVDQASYNILYPPTEELLRIFSNIFSSANFIPLEKILSLIPYNEMISLSFIADFLFGNVPLQFGKTTGYLKKTGNLLYVTENPTMPVDTMMPVAPLRDRSITSSELLEDLEKTWLMKSIQSIFRNPLQAKSILHKLPRDYQHLLLTACLYANEIKTGDQLLIQTILNYYRGFYHKGKIIYVWLFHEKFGTIQLSLSSDTARWKPAKRDVYQEFRQRIYSSPVGYYGLYNPHLNEFCLRKITHTTETDLRKVNVGRRCDDWDQKSLLKILNDKLGLEVDPNDYNRSNLCNIIKRKMFERELVLYNFDCGNQFKIRGRI